MTPRKVLVIQTAFIGDIILTAPLLHAMRANWPNAEIHLCTTPAGAALHGANADVKRIWVYDKKGKDRGLGALMRLGVQFKQESFDLLLCPHRSFRSGLLAWASGVRRRIGYRESASRWFMTETVKRDMIRHEVDRLLDLLAPLAINADKLNRTTPLHTSDEANRKADEWMAKEGLKAGEFIGVVPGSVWATKRWTPEGFAAVIGALEQQGQPCVLLGGPDDAVVERQISDKLGRSPRSLVGKTDLSALVAIVSRARGLVTNDSGPLHIASMNAIPTVAIFGSTVLGLGFGPLAQRHRVVEVALDCRPCGLHGHPSCPKGHFKCMRDITPERVLVAIGEVILKTDVEAACA